MSIYNNINGGIKEVKGLFENKNGGIIEIQEKWENQNSVNRLVYQGLDFPPGPEYPAVPPNIPTEYLVDRPASAGYSFSAEKYYTLSPGGTNKFTKLKANMYVDTSYTNMNNNSIWEYWYVDGILVGSMNMNQYTSKPLYGSFEWTMPQLVKEKINKGQSVSLRVYLTFSRASTGKYNYGDWYYSLTNIRFQ